MSVAITIIFGVALGYIAWLEKWSFLKTIVISTALGVVIGIGTVLLETESQSAEIPTGKLKVATAHIQNGSGFVVKAPSGKTYLTTNNHVCLHGSWHEVLSGSLETGEVLRGKITKRSLRPDLCAAEVSRFPTPLDIADTVKLRERVFTRGYPMHILSESQGKVLGEIQWEYEFSIEEIGECFAPGTKSYGGDGLLRGCVVLFTDNVTDLYGRPGSSGSPVVNSQGELVGVMSSWNSQADAAGMVRLKDIKEFFKDL